MAGADEGGIRVEGSLVHLDASPARLLAQLRDAASDTFVTALTADGASRHERLPAAVRRARYQLAGRSVEATPTAAFVAVTTEDGRLIVAALEGEVVVVASSGNRTAVAAHETLVSEADDAEPRVVATSALPAGDRVAVDAAITEVSEALAQPMPEVEPVEAVAPAEATEATEPTEPAAAAVEPEPAAAAADADVTDVEEAVAEEEEVERRGVAIGIAVGAVIAVAALVAALLLLSDDDEVAGPRPTTTAAPQTTAVATTTAAEPPTTTAAPTTTATTARAVASYDLRPEACRQSGDTVTLTGEIANNADDAWRFTVSAVFRDAQGRVLDRGRTEVGPVAPGATETFTVTGDAPRRAAGCDVDNVETEPAGG